MNKKRQKCEIKKKINHGDTESTELRIRRLNVLTADGYD